MKSKNGQMFCNGRIARDGLCEGRKRHFGSISSLLLDNGLRGGGRFPANKHLAEVEWALSLSVCQHERFKEASTQHRLVAYFGSGSSWT